jgi:hypothetical protein
MSREEIDQANNVLQTVEHQLAKAVASRDLASWIWSARSFAPLRMAG